MLGLLWWATTSWPCRWEGRMWEVITWKKESVGKSCWSQKAVRGRGSQDLVICDLATMPGCVADLLELVQLCAKFWCTRLSWYIVNFGSDLNVFWMPEESESQFAEHIWMHCYTCWAQLTQVRPWEQQILSCSKMLEESVDESWWTHFDVSLLWSTTMIDDHDNSP